MDYIKKTRADYNKIAKYFSNTRTKLWPELIKFKPLVKNGQHILDWGCGNGRLLQLFKGKDVKYYGLDQSSELLKVAREINRKEVKFGKARFYNTAKKDKKFPNEFFDLAFVIASFFHLPDQKSRLKLLQKIQGELKPQGKLIMTVWNLESDWAKKRKKEWEYLGNDDYLIPWKDSNGKILVRRYYHNFREKEIRDLLIKGGLKAKKISFSSKQGFKNNSGGRNMVVEAVKIVKPV